VVLKLLTTLAPSLSSTKTPGRLLAEVVDVLVEEDGAVGTLDGKEVTVPLLFT
jgi:hypothetical protein